MSDSNEQTVVDAKLQIEQSGEEYRKSVDSYILAASTGADLEMLLSALLKVHRAGTRLFNRVDELVGNSGLLGAHDNALWATGFAEDCYTHLDSLIAHYEFLRGAYKKLKPGVLSEIEPSDTAYANLQRMVVEYLPHKKSSEIKERLQQHNMPIFGFDNKARDMSNPPTWQTILGLVFGFFAVVGISVESFVVPDPTEWQQFVARGIFGLGLSAVSAIVPGFLNVKSKIKTGAIYFSIVAGGAIAIFVIVWYINPPSLIHSITH